MKIKKEIKQAITREIREDARAEAIAILLASPNSVSEEFMDYYNKDQGNICCLVLDTAKMQLVKNGKMEQKPDDAFGKPTFFNMDLDDLKDKAAEVSDEKFGRNNPATAPIHHLFEEVQELLECLENGIDPQEEFADCFLVNGR